MTIESKEEYSDKYLGKHFAIQKLIKNFFNSIKEILSETEVNKVLEVGCGLGFSTQYLSEALKDKNFQASEYRIDFVEEAQKRNPDIKVQQESIYSLKRDVNSFDMVIALEVLEHLENPELALRELHRVTSRYCLLSVPQEPLWRFLNLCRLKYLKELGNTPGHIQHWSRKNFIRFLNPCFKVKQIRTPLPWIVALTEKKG